MTTAEFGALNYGILFGYLAAIFGIGLWVAGRQKTTEDYFLAGRRMPWFVVASPRGLRRRPTILPE